MLRFVVLALFVAAASAVDLPSFGIGGRIVGGRNASIEEFPWQISLRRKTADKNPFKHSCGGSILNERIVLCAAHCVVNRDPKQYVIVAGSSHKSGGDGVLVRVAKFVWHEAYDSKTKDNDVSLILLETPLPLNKHSIVPMTLATENPAAGDVVTITGWGALKFFGSSPEILQAVNVPIVSNSECAQKYSPSPILESMICAGSSVGGKDACQGDSGGPLVISNVQYGIVSWGNGCAKATHPGVYSSVAILRQWIDANIEKLMLE
ncbi:zetaTry family protein [Megaselia abdita]